MNLHAASQSCAVAAFSALLALTAVNNRVSGQCVTTEFQKVVASNGAGGDVLGRSVSISGDAAIVGSRDNNDIGAAYIYRWDGHGWLEEIAIPNPGEGPTDLFGARVSMSGDVAAVAAVGDNDHGLDSGSLYLYRFREGAWTLEQKLHGTHDYEYMGGNVSIDGDVVLIYRNVGVTFYRFDGVTWNEEQSFSTADPTGQDGFGNAMSVSGDAAIIGAYWDHDNGFRAGAVYFYRYDREAGSWYEEKKLLEAEGAAEDNFGWSVSMSGDVAIVGARGDDDNGSGTGSAFVYRYDGAAWVEEAQLVASDGEWPDWFGYAVAIDGDMAVCTTYSGDGVVEDSGTAYVYRRSGKKWVEQAEVYASDGGVSDRFGFSAALDNGVAIFGTPKDDDLGTSSGAAYLVHGLADCNTNGAIDLCDIVAGTSMDNDANGIPDECEPDPCPWDITGDDMVGPADLAAVLGNWGPVPPNDPNADLTGDGMVDAADIAVVLGNWGPCL